MSPNGCVFINLQVIIHNKPIEVFKLKQGGFKITKNQFLKRLPIIIIATFRGLVIFHFSPNNKQDDFNVYPIVIPIILGAIVVGFLRGIKIQKKIFESYTLTIDREQITREQHNTPIITLSFKDISEIIKNSNGSFTIKGGSSISPIGVPAHIEDYEKLEIHLSKIMPITIRSSTPILLKYNQVLVIPTIGLMAAVYLSYNKVIVAVCGVCILALLSYTF